MFFTPNRSRKFSWRADFTEVRAPAPPEATHTFRVKAPLLAKGQTLCLCGEGAKLGNWDTAKPDFAGLTRREK